MSKLLTRSVVCAIINVTKLKGVGTMRHKWKVLLVIVVLALLTGCNSTAPVQTTGTTTAQPSETTVPETTVSVTTVPETPAPETTAAQLLDESCMEGLPRDTQPWPQEGAKGITFLTEQDLAQLTWVFSDTNYLPGANMPQNWYARALVTAYETPAQMQLLDFFYSGIFPKWHPESEVSEQEQEYLIKELDYPDHLHPHRLPADEMDDILEEYFNLDLEDMDWSIQKLDYWKKTDCYYFAANDARILYPFAFEKGYMTEDGTVRLYYYNEIYQWPFIVTLQAKEQDYGYWVLSNLPVE